MTQAGPARDPPTYHWQHLIVINRLTNIIFITTMSHLKNACRIFVIFSTSPHYWHLYSTSEAPYTRNENLDTSYADIYMSYEDSSKQPNDPMGSPLTPLGPQCPPLPNDLHEKSQWSYLLES